MVQRSEKFNKIYCNRIVEYFENYVKEIFIYRDAIAYEKSIYKVEWGNIDNLSA